MSVNSSKFRTGFLFNFIPPSNRNSDFPVSKIWVFPTDGTSRRGGSKKTRTLDTFAFDMCLISYLSKFDCKFFEGRDFISL